MGNNRLSSAVTEKRGKHVDISGKTVRVIRCEGDHKSSEGCVCELAKQRATVRVPTDSRITVMGGPDSYRIEWDHGKKLLRSTECVVLEG